MPAFDVTLLTEARYTEPVPGNAYIENIFKEDNLLRDALEKRGLKVHRTRWDDPDMNWSDTRFALFRTTWDYFERFAEFSEWLDKTEHSTQFLNRLPLVRWNIDKHYLADLQNAGVPIPPTLFIPRGTQESLQSWADKTDWQEMILKPTIAGTARHTYRFDRSLIADMEGLFSRLTSAEDFMLQAFQPQILTRGEVTFVVFGGKFSHAVLKKAKPGDFRVQDDFGGSVHSYDASIEEIAFAENAVRQSPHPPVYARVDAMWDEKGNLMVSELEMIEPELWLRMHPPAAESFADSIVRAMQDSDI